MYTKVKGGLPLCVIPIEDILAVEKLQEESFKMKYVSGSLASMITIVQIC